MFLLRSESESSADFAVSQDCNLQTDQTCPTMQVSSIGLQIKNPRYSPADAGRYAFGLTSNRPSSFGFPRGFTFRFSDFNFEA